MTHLPATYESERFTLRSSPPAQQKSFAEEVAKGLGQTPKALPSRFFYDAIGSAIFEEICELPEYYLTRCERAILARSADEIARSAASDAALVELGSGSAEKTQLLIEAALRRETRLTFVPIDISRSALEQSAAALVRRFPRLEVHALEAEYEEGLSRLHDLEDEPLLIAWLGSSIGNLRRTEAASFLSRVRKVLLPEDRLLIGFDLRKDAETLEAAYNDAQGVTARFNLNLLERINRELGGEFEPERFRFRARYREEAGVVESHLVSVGEQRVPIEALEDEIHFADGETIHTEDSFKYSQQEIESLATEAGLVAVRHWQDRDAQFSLSLLAPRS